MQLTVVNERRKFPMIHQSQVFGHFFFVFPVIAVLRTQYAW
jgi:hypothetical protein